MYPIAAFIQDRMMESGLSRGTLASATGYLNVSKALRHLDRLRQGGRTPPEFQAGLIAALGVEQADFEAAVEATRKMQRDEEQRRRETEVARARAEFRPHLRIIPERNVPQPIFVAAWTGVDFWLVEALPGDILAMPRISQLNVVGQIARAHYARTGGRAGPFDAIRCYLFRTEFERAIELDIDGTPRGQHRGPCRNRRRCCE